MIARTIIETQNRFLVPNGQQYTLFPEELGPYVVVVRPPLALEETLTSSIANVTIDDQAAFTARALVIDFHADAFDRRQASECDPPLDLIKEAANRFLRRVRFSGKAGVVEDVEFPNCAWQLNYLNDDESEIPHDPDLIRGRGSLKLAFSWITLDNSAWDAAFQLGPNFDPPGWHSLLLDASEHLPQVGPALAIAGTAMEVFIASTLNSLVASSPLPSDWWSWINNRGNHLKEPSVEEQFGKLLKLLTGHSATELGSVWESFAQLRAARNKFVHTGAATLAGVPVSSAQAQLWITDLWRLTEMIRNWLPAEAQWPIYSQPSRTISVAMQIGQAPQSTPAQMPPET